MVGNVLELYARCGKSLLKNGVCEAVLPISETENAVSLFYENNLLILGGDLYKETTFNSFKFIYETWYYEGFNVKESVEEALKYLKNFQNQHIFVVFILKNI